MDDCPYQSSYFIFKSLKRRNHEQQVLQINIGHFRVEFQRISVVSERMFVVSKKHQLEKSNEQNDDFLDYTMVKFSDSHVTRHHWW